MAARARGEGKTPIKNIRVETDEWDAFGAACKLAGADRSAVIRDFARWYTRQPGSTMPKRPDPDLLIAAKQARDGGQS
ncbi:hypothetical protein [Lentzea guizhouensis]|uniref:hypothetical protein n=1 Tax=Lentzea guizhouensis TaxID=1586287 RepID=UPI0012B68E49|nr:hypothetical protein [Lentzea guizhouensis]